MAGVKRHEDLDCWKLATELADLYDQMTAAGPASRDTDLKKQLRKSGTKAPAQIAEGFGRYLPGDFADFLRTARASLCESQTHLDRGRRNYWPPDQVARARRLSDRAIGATTNLMLDRLRAADASKRKPTASPRNPRLSENPRRTQQPPEPT
jgi:four helix bundle protein